jgi:hypothetical protein
MPLRLETYLWPNKVLHEISSGCVKEELNNAQTLDYGQEDGKQV